MTQQQGTSASKDAAQGQAPVTNGGNFGLTVSAAARITKMLADEPDGSFFRVAVLGGGCSGFQYDFSIDVTKQPDDCVFSAHDVEIVIDAMSLELVDAAELDYKQDLMGSYFAVNNPNATASCGCGTSFSV
jgi:iron-sulfur cluster insertion protein